MLSTELKKLLTDLENGVDNIQINPNELMKELKELDNIQGTLCHSLSMSSNVCPTCGKRLN